MAGFLARADIWASFSYIWAAALAAPPSIEYLKMKEAQNLSGQFRGWSSADRDIKISRLMRVINNFKPLSFEFSVSREQVDRLVRPTSPRGLGSAHFYCTFGVVATLTRYVSGEGVSVPIDFVFDEQSGVSEDISIFFSLMKSKLPKEARRLITSTPIFRDDKHFLPLQAADMLAWHLRREYEDFGERGKLEGANILRSSYHIHSEVPESVLQQWANHFSKMPGLDGLQTKSGWRKFKRRLPSLIASGFVPPYGTRWKNTLYGARERIARFLRS